MAISASERTSNVVETVRAYLATLTITGTPTVVRLDGVRPPRSITSPRLEWQVERETGTALGGNGDGTRTVGASALLTIDLRWPAAQHGDDATAILKAQDDVLYALRRWSAWLLDYGTGDSTQRISTLGEPQPSTLEPINNQPRRRIRVRLHWLALTDH